jgi:hypothetical protein
MRVRGAIVLPRKEDDEGQRGDLFTQRENDGVSRVEC